MRTRDIFVGLLVLCPVAGCGGDAAGGDDSGFGDEPLGEAEGALAGENALTLNALTLNALTLNALHLSALNLNALSPQSLSALQNAGSLGTLARSFVRYAASCALRPDQAFTFSWTDSNGASHNESYAGALGIYPEWATGPLKDAGQRMVSACVASRVNYYQTPVAISIRSLQAPLKTSAGSAELTTYNKVEGAFWGNLFDSTPFINACYNSATVANSRAHLRDCAVGHLVSGGGVEECGIIHIAGSCSQLCQALNGAGQYYPSCIERPGESGSSTKLVITVGLP